MSVPQSTAFRPLAGALGVTLCAGAAWALVGILIDSEASFMAAPAAFAAALGAGWVPVRRTQRGLLGVGLFGIAVVYALYLRAAVVVTGGLGLGFGDVLAQLGPEMAWAIIRARLDTLDLGILVGCLLLTVFGSARARRQAR